MNTALALCWPLALLAGAGIAALLFGMRRADDNLAHLGDPPSESAP
jgi:hypothetical protein